MNIVRLCGVLLPVLFYQGYMDLSTFVGAVVVVLAGWMLLQWQQKRAQEAADDRFYEQQKRHAAQLKNDPVVTMAANMKLYAPKIGPALDAIKAGDLEAFKQAMSTMHQSEVVYANGADAADARHILQLLPADAPAALPASLQNRGLVGEVGDSILSVASKNVDSKAWK